MTNWYIIIDIALGISIGDGIEWWQVGVFRQSEEAIPMSLRHWWPLFWALLIDCWWYGGGDDDGGGGEYDGRGDDHGGEGEDGDGSGDDIGLGLGGWFDGNPYDPQELVTTVLNSRHRFQNCWIVVKMLDSEN